eukprot:11989835-Ditylum_brightwellii.AAC.1
MVVPPQERKRLILTLRINWNKSVSRVGQHVAGKALHHGLCCDMKVAQHFSSAPAANQFDDVRITSAKEVAQGIGNFGRAYLPETVHGAICGKWHVAVGAL